MNRISLTKIIIALLICNIYAFSTSVVGSFGTTPIETAPVDLSAPAVQPPEETSSEEAHGQGTIDFIADDTEQTVIDVKTMHFASPPLSEMAVYTTYQTRGDTAEPEQADDINEGAFEEEEFNIVDTYEPSEDERDESEPEEAVTTAATTATTTTAATTASTTTTTKTTTSMPEDLPDEIAPTEEAETEESEPEDTATSTTFPLGGIPVDGPSGNTTAATTTTTTTKKESESQPTEIVTNEDAANELLTVNNGGTMLTGKALDIIAGITQTEVGHTFAPEAIKAQAVAAYSYVKFCNAHSIQPNVIVSDNVRDSVRVLVASVIGQAVYYDGSIIQATYTASSAGHTASSENVWGMDYPYLRSVYCELDAQYDPNYGRQATFTSTDIKQRVLSKTGIALSGDPSEWFSIDSRYDGKYVAQLNIGGYHSYTDSSGKTVKISGRVFREKIMGFDIRSNAFDIEYNAASDSFTITTYGYGHGVGMSQNGAHALATYWGYDYKQILQFYYSGTEVY